MLSVLFPPHPIDSASSSLSVVAISDAFLIRLVLAAAVSAASPNLLRSSVSGFISHSDSASCVSALASALSSSVSESKVLLILSSHLIVSLVVTHPVALISHSQSFISTSALAICPFVLGPSW